MKIKEIIVVEGKDDTAKIQQAMEADTIETNGSAINKEIIERIRHAKKKRGVIIFTDPDYPGQRIRHIVDQAVPGCKHAFLTQDEARAKNPLHNSLGIEHASPESIRLALSKVYELTEQTTGEITKEDLVNNRLIGVSEASERRRRLGEYLKIGHTNGKQLLKRLNQFQISKKEFDAAIETIRKEDNK
ncbi:ribonuclease M5 [Oceanobacillus sp. CAU 1775]